MVLGEIVSPGVLFHANARMATATSRRPLVLPMPDGHGHGEHVGHGIPAVMDQVAAFCFLWRRRAVQAGSRYLAGYS